MKATKNYEQNKHRFSAINYPYIQRIIVDGPPRKSAVLQLWRVLLTCHRGSYSKPDSRALLDILPCFSASDFGRLAPPRVVGTTDYRGRIIIAAS